MKKVSVIGHFAFGSEILDGQTVKTKILTKELVRVFGDENVLRYDTHGRISSLIKAPFYALGALSKSENIIILPAHNSLRVYGRLLPFFRHFFRHRKLHYSVIGGWLPDILKNKTGLRKALRKFDGIYVETATMKAALEAQGFENISVVANCKELTPIPADEPVRSAEQPYKLCTFSRVMREKGIEDAVDAVRTVNERLGKTFFTLDIYGQVDPGQTEWFERLSANLPEYIKYAGSVRFDKSVEVLKDYFALLFPTRFFTEGVPGTIIDAYASGVPVISSEWQSFSDIITDGVTGIGYKFGSPDALVECLSEIAKNPGRLISMKPDCLKKSLEYMPQKALLPLIKELK